MISRRRFLKASLGLSAGVIGTRLLADFSFANQLSPFPAPTDIGERTGNQVVFRLEATAKSVQVGDQQAQLLTYNGSFPGPTLRMREGDSVRVEFTNNLSEETNLHFHGLHVPMTQRNSETPFRRVAPGETILYEFPIPEGSAGTYWYHPHTHGSVAPQLFSGLAGAIIIEGPMGAVFQDLNEQLVVLKDFTLTPQGAIPEYTRMDWMMGREGKLLTVNGAALPTLEVTNGAVRLRLINASNARYYRLALPEAGLNVIGTDGGYVAEPYAVTELLIAPGERYDVIAQFARAGMFNLNTLPYNRAPEDMMEMGEGASDGVAMGEMDMDGMDMDGMDMGGSSMDGMNMGDTSQEGSTDTSMDGMDMSGSESTSMMQTGVSEPTPLLRLEVSSPSTYRVPTELKPIRTLSPEDASTRRRIVLTEDMMNLEFYINGQLFAMDRVDFAPTLGTVEHWEIVNETGMDHPMHLHVFPFQVYARNGERAQNLAWKDVVNVAAGETVDILIPFEDFTGRTVFHCHVVEHEDLGMMSIVEVSE